MLPTIAKRQENLRIVKDGEWALSRTWSQGTRRFRNQNQVVKNKKCGNLKVNHQSKQYQSSHKDTLMTRKCMTLLQVIVVLSQVSKLISLMSMWTSMTNHLTSSWTKRVNLFSIRTTWHLSNTTICQLELSVELIVVLVVLLDNSKTKESTHKSEAKFSAQDQVKVTVVHKATIQIIRCRD